MAHLPDALVERLLSDVSFQPGGRPSHFRAVVPKSVSDVEQPPATIERPGPAVGWLFKETAAERQRRRHSAADRWRNCGGVAGARDLPAGRPVLRRRYGKLTPAASNTPLRAWCAQPHQPGEKRTATHRTTRPTVKEGFAYHEYTLLDRSRTRQDGAFEDNTSVYLFHVIPVRDAMAEAPRLGLPDSVALNTEEERSLSAILRVEGFGEIPGPESDRGQLQLAKTEESRTLPTEEVIRRICDTSYEPGHRPSLLNTAKHGWLFKEPGRHARLRRGQHEDRWKHSGGQKGAKDLYLGSNTGRNILDANAQAMCSRPVVRRRSGVIQPPGRTSLRWRYHQYTLLARKIGQNGEEEWEEDLASPILFHVQLPDRKLQAPKAALQTATEPAAAIPETDPSNLSNPSAGYTELFGESCASSRLAQEIPLLDSELVQSLPSFASRTSSHKRQASAAPALPAGKRRAQTAPVVGAVKRTGAVEAAPIVTTVTAVPSSPTLSTATIGASYQQPHQASDPTSLLDAIKLLEWWQPGDSLSHTLESSGSFRRTRSSFALPLSSGRSNELSALPSFGWLGPSETNMFEEIKTTELAMLPKGPS